MGSDWQVIPATTAWDGTSIVGHDDPIVDQLIQPKQLNRCKDVYLCGPYAWGLAAPYTLSVEDLAAAQLAKDAADHPCPATAESQEQATIGGQAALVMSRHCPADGGGLLVVSAVVVKEGSGYQFYMQDPSRDAASEAQTMTDFVNFIGGITLP